MVRSLLPLSAVLGALACATPPPGGFADTVWVGGPVHTPTPGDAEAVAARDGLIVFVGSASEVESYIGLGTRVVELGGELLLPGFVDNHNHLGEGGEVSCLPDIDLPLADQAALLADCALGVEPGAWVIGYGSALELEVELGAGPVLGRPVDTMDAAFPDNPAIIMDYSSHAMFVNTRAYAEAGLSASSPDPQGGVLMKDENGELNGVLLDNAGDRVMELAVNSVSGKLDLFYDGILDGLDQVRRAGITTVGDGRSYWRRGALEAWQQVEADGLLSARVSVRPWVYPDLAMCEQLPFLEGAHQSDPSKLLIVDQVKMYSDGVPEYGTGRVIEPYLLSYVPEHPNGINYIPLDAMRSWLAELDALGYGAHIHAIGDLGVRETLDAIGERREAGSTQRYHMTHLSMVDPADLPRFAALGVDADLQLHAPHASHADESADYVELIGEQRASQLLFTPLAELSDSGANVVLSSDWTVNPLSPLIALSYAVEEGSLTHTEALDAYTINGARALGLDALTGSIEVGKSADFVRVDVDLRTASPAEIRAATITMTVLRGEVVY